MNTHARQLKALGTPEYILAKAGLYGLGSSEESGYCVRNGLELERIFRTFGGQEIPPPEVLLPLLLEVVTVAVMERGGALEMRGERGRTTAAILDLGVAAYRVGDMRIAIDKAAEVVAEEMRNRPPLYM